MSSRESAHRTDHRQLLESVVSLFDVPAAVIGSGGEILGSNESWPQVEKTMVNGVECATLEDCLRGFDGVGQMLQMLRSPYTSDRGESKLVRTQSVLDGELSGYEYTTRWFRIEYPPDVRWIAVVSLTVSNPSGISSPGLEEQQKTIEQLIVRQTLIEEAERLRVGRMLHDTVVQDLALTRGQIADQVASGVDPTATIASIDRIIDQIRTLSFELSPPILDDLGILPALRWLSDHLKTRYGVEISIIDDGREPPLSMTTRTILFRAVRELAINAAKHATGAEIVVTCLTYSSTVRVRVRDFGKGFDVSGASFPDGNPGYGLLSVEKQVRGIGGKFELVSELEEGTRATVTVPLERRELESDGE